MSRERRGFALVVALLALVCIAALLSGLAYIARQDHLLAITRRDSRRAFVAAEGAAWAVAAQLDGSHLALPRGQEIAVAVPRFFADSTRGAVLRIGTATFLLSGEATAGAGDQQLWRRVGVVADVRRDSTGAVIVRPLPQRFWLELP